MRLICKKHVLHDAAHTFCSVLDLDENLAFETETGNQLADWMSWRCNIGR